MKEFHNESNKRLRKPKINIIHTVLLHMFRRFPQVFSESDVLELTQWVKSLTEKGGKQREVQRLRFTSGIVTKSFCIDYFGSQKKVPQIKTEFVFR